jgi:hypothetical protein
MTTTKGSTMSMMMKTSVEKTPALPMIQHTPNTTKIEAMTKIKNQKSKISLIHA